MLAIHPNARTTPAVRAEIARSTERSGVLAERYGVSRQAQDEFALESTQRAIRAQKEGAFKAEIVPVSVPQKKGDPVLVTEDEGPKNAKPDKIATLKPVFKKDGTVTAANASSINDGAAALVLMSAERAKAAGCPVLVVPQGHALPAICGTAVVA